MSWRTLCLALAATAVAAACGGGQREAEPRASASARQGEDGAGAGRATRGPRGCPVTLNNTRVPPPHERPQLPEKGNAYYTNGRLWTILGDDGTIRGPAHRDGSIRQKFPWWRGTRGRLSITGRRLDHPRPVLRANVPAGYGPIGFQATGIAFPTGGCWKVTGSAGGARLTFVTLVVEP